MIETPKQEAANKASPLSKGTEKRVKFDFEPAASTWARFLAGEDERALKKIAKQQHGKLNWYRIDAIKAIAGAVPAGLAAGWSLVRIERDAPHQLEAESPSAVDNRMITFHGVTQHLHYTNTAQSRELDSRSHAELAPSQETTAVLIPIGKSPDWWQLAQDRRQAHFQTGEEYPGHVAIGIEYVDRVHRKLYHSRYTEPPTAYDFLTYFEFESRHKDDFNMLLHELRDTIRIPEWKHIALEYEIWMSKIG